MMTDTQALLADFVKNGSEAAFRELVGRYVDLVYSTAVRLVDGDTHRAQDVAQIVFADLARMASKLSGSTMLGGWLHRHTCFVARTVMRGERRRHARERQAVEMNALNDENGSVLGQIAPILDEAIQELGPDDRDAILLRFFERRNLRSVGEALGINENVAQKRVSRAVQELGALLRRRGVALSTAALASGLAAGAVTAAPAGLALGITGGVFAGAGAAGGAGSTLAKLAITAKVKAAVLSAVVIAGVVTAVFLKTTAKAPVHDEAPALAQQADQPVSEEAAPDSSSRTAVEPPVSTPSDPRAARPVAARTALASPGVIRPPAREAAPVPPQTATDLPDLPIQRFAATGESRVRIEGTSNLQDWQVEGSTIYGFLEIGSDFPKDPGQMLQPGPVQVRAEAYIPVGSLKSVDKEGRPNSDTMDRVMYRSLRAEQKQNSRIYYRVVDMFLKGATNRNDVLEYQCEARGELAVAGVTNEITMPVFVLPLGRGKLRISGRTSLKMTSFQVDPPIETLASIRARDNVKVIFEWVVASKGIASTLAQAGMVPLILELPAPAFGGTPKGLRAMLEAERMSFGPDVEPLSEQPRAPMLVPAGLTNLARGSKLSCSDTNVAADALARIVDGDKESSDRRTVLLRKGRQWVQLDLGRPQEVFAIVIWHAYNIPMVYHDVVVQLSDDAEFVKNVRTIFNNDKDNSTSLGAGTDREYVETHEGKLINAKGIKARYVRCYSRGSTESALNGYKEIEVYGRRGR